MIFSGEVDQHRQQRLERLRKLGVRKGAQDFARPAQAPAPEAAARPLPARRRSPHAVRPRLGARGPLPARRAPGARGMAERRARDPGRAQIARDLLLDLVPAGAVFIDTETTGLSLGAGTYTFLIGVGHIRAAGGGGCGGNR